jgi:hypothetical protein
MERVRRAAHAGSWYTNNGTYFPDPAVMIFFNYFNLLSCCFFRCCLFCLFDLIHDLIYMADVVSTLVTDIENHNCLVI